MENILSKYFINLIDRVVTEMGDRPKVFFAKIAASSIVFFTYLPTSDIDNHKILKVGTEMSSLSKEIFPSVSFHFLYVSYLTGIGPTVILILCTITNMKGSTKEHTVLVF